MSAEHGSQTVLITGATDGLGKLPHCCLPDEATASLRGGALGGEARAA